MDKSTQTELPVQSANEKGFDETFQSFGIVYKITCNLTGKCYYGSTIQTLSKRASVHKLESNMASSREIVKNGDWKIEAVEEVVFKNKLELLQRERFHIENDSNAINKNRPCVTLDERKIQVQNNMKKWYLNHRAEHIHKMTQYNIDHIDKHREAMRKYANKCRTLKKVLKNKIIH